jgi:hypothetical protein
MNDSAMLQSVLDWAKQALKTGFSPINPPSNKIQLNDQTTVLNLNFLTSVQNLPIFIIFT